MLSFDDVKFDYQPYPIGLARNVLAPDVYGEMVRTFPDGELLEQAREVKGLKYQLSRRHHRKDYHRHVRQHAVWKRFYDYIQSDGFVDGIFDMLEQQGIDLGLRRPPLAERLDLRKKAWKKGSPQPRFSKISARFEFMAMPAMGGCIPPHTDHPSKVITLVLAMLEEGDWDPADGGGTSIVWPKDDACSYNYMNRYMDFDEVEEVRSIPYRPNQCIVFLKTHDSWHAVWPMKGSDPQKLRKTLTINIEAS
jgi:hypothetical protein